MDKGYMRVLFEWRPLLEPLTDEEVGRLFTAALKYSATGIEPVLTGNERFAFCWFKISIDEDRRKRANRGKGGQKGAAHWNWKGGVTPQNQAERTSGKYTQWRNAVFARDDYCCQRCGQIGGELQAHHIEHWAKNKDLRFVVSNGITLCKRCHKAEHRG